MKKFYAFAAAAVMAVSAFAQDGEPLYATGAGGFANGEWNAETPDEFVYADGKYTLEVANLTQIKISTAAGSWDAFDGGVLGCAYGDEQGVAVPLEAGYNANIVAPWKGDYTITVAGDLSTVTLTTSTPAPAPGEITPVFVRGDMNGWGSPEEWQMTSYDGNVYGLVLADDQVIAVGESFKLADADWNAINVGGDGEAILLDTATEVFNGGNPANMTLVEECTGCVWLILDLDGASYIYFSNDKDYVPDWAEEAVSGVAGVAVDENAPAVYYNLQGIRVANPENGMFIQVKGNKVSKVVR